MLLNLSWVIPGIPLLFSVFIAILLVSFSRTMNRLTKPVSLLFIFSIVFSTLFSFVLYEKHISGILSPLLGFELFNKNFKLYIDSSALLVSTVFGFTSIIAMLISYISLKRRTGYVRYFISLGLLSGLAFIFVFSGSIFHDLVDPVLVSFERIGLQIS